MAAAAAAALRAGPRPWQCNTNPGAIFCTLHGDCTCNPRSVIVDLDCPLHGVATDHPSAPRLVVRR